MATLKRGQRHEVPNPFVSATSRRADAQRIARRRRRRGRVIARRSLSRSTVINVARRVRATEARRPGDLRMAEHRAHFHIRSNMERGVQAVKESTEAPICSIMEE